MLRSLDLHNPGIILHISDTEMSVVGSNVIKNVINVATEKIVDEFLKNNKQKINIYLQRSLKKLARQAVIDSIKQKEITINFKNE